MGNPLYNLLQGGRGANAPGPMDNIGQMIQSFQQFRRIVQQVQGLSQSGKMTQQQFNQLEEVSNMLQGLLNGN